MVENGMHGARGCAYTRDELAAERNYTQLAALSKTVAPVFNNSASTTRACMPMRNLPLLRGLG
jgi:hypothetical protein